MDQKAEEHELVKSWSLYFDFMKNLKIFLYRKLYWQKMKKSLGKENLQGNFLLDYFIPHIY